jgi:hypothetical protein
MAFSRLEKAMAAVIGIEIATPGFSRAAAKKAVSLIARTAPPVARTAMMIPGAPQALGAGLGYAALQTDPGQQLLAAAEEHGRQSRIQVERAVQDALALAPIRRKKRMSKFNKSVKKGMAIVKASTSYGKKGIINSPKKAFAAVTKTVSKVNKGKKVTAKGVLGKVGRAAADILKKRGVGRLGVSKKRYFWG